MLRRRALIIGNDHYTKSRLENCIKDATQLATTLKNVSYTVDLQTNLKSVEMYNYIKMFVETIESNDFIIFFFAGHGMQWGDQNFLFPCDNDQIETGDDMQRFAINAQRLANQLADMRPRGIVMLLDCCREYWLPKKGRAVAQSTGGLHVMEAPPGTLIAFACAPGETTPDRILDSTNGIFTKCLLQHITTPGIDIDVILRRVAKDVSKETNNKQRPYRVSSMVEEDVYIVPPGKCLFHYSNSSRGVLVYGGVEMLLFCVDQIIESITDEEHLATHCFCKISRAERAEKLRIKSVDNEDRTESSCPILYKKRFF